MSWNYDIICTSGNRTSHIWMFTGKPFSFEDEIRAFGGSSEVPMVDGCHHSSWVNRLPFGHYWEKGYSLWRAFPQTPPGIGCWRCEWMFPFFQLLWGKQPWPYYFFSFFQMASWWGREHLWQLLLFDREVCRSTVDNWGLRSLDRVLCGSGDHRAACHKISCTQLQQEPRLAFHLTQLAFRVACLWGIASCLEIVTIIRPSDVEHMHPVDWQHHTLLSIRDFWARFWQSTNCI